MQTQPHAARDEKKNERKSSLKKNPALNPS